MESESQRFKQARKKLELTLQDLVLMTGYSMSTISGVENGHDRPSKRLRQLLIDRLGINETWLNTGRGEIFKGSQETAIAQIIADDSKIFSPAETELTNDPEFLVVLNKLRRMPSVERKQRLVAMNRILDELVKIDKKSQLKQGSHNPSDKVFTLLAEIISSNGQEYLSKKSKKAN